MCALVSRVHMMFFTLIKGYTVSGNQGLHDKLNQIRLAFIDIQPYSFNRTRSQQRARPVTHPSRGHRVAQPEKLQLFRAQFRSLERASPTEGCLAGDFVWMFLLFLIRKRNSGILYVYWNYLLIIAQTFKRYYQQTLYRQNLDTTNSRQTTTRLDNS